MEHARISALAAKKTRYQTVLPCKRGHLGERYSVNGVCIRCDVEFIKPKMRAKKRLSYVPKIPIADCAHCGAPFEKRNNACAYCSTGCRFWSKVDKVDPQKCWEWTGAKTKLGYGQFRLGETRADAKIIHAHRVAYELGSGVPLSSLVRKKWGDLFVCHTCDNSLCVNPRHLYLGSHTTNMHDMDTRGRRVRRSGGKYSTAKMQKVINLRKDGMSQMAIAAKVCIPQTIVSEMLRGKYKAKR